MKVSSTDFQNSVGRYLALLEKEDIIITKNGKSVAKLTAYNVSDDFVVNETKGYYNIKNEINYEEYLELTNSSDQRYELIDGKVYLLASPSFRHQVMVGEIYSHLRQHLVGKPCKALTSPLDIRLFGWATKFSEDPNIVQPDLVVICDQEKVDKDGKYHGTPTLIAEVLSPSTKGKDKITKLNLYQRSGIREYWIVDPENCNVTLYAFTKERELELDRIFAKSEILQSSIFPDLTLKLAEVFNPIE